MLYAFVDANIFIRVISQGRPGCEPEHFKDLVTLVRGGVMRLLVPEILALELEKQFRELPRQFESNCDKLKESLTKATSNVWNEIDALKVDLLTQIEVFKKKGTECEHRTAKIMNFLTSDAATPIRLTNEIWLDTKRRLIAGRMPRPRVHPTRMPESSPPWLHSFRLPTKRAQDWYFALRIRRTSPSSASLWTDSGYSP